MLGWGYNGDLTQLDLVLFSLFCGIVLIGFLYIIKKY